MASELSGLLRTVRLNAGCSQLELALRLDVSQRHVNFIERDRARPSRALLLAWLREMGGGTSLANAALLNAGYAPLRPSPRLPASPTRCDEVALRTIALHYPNPGHVFNADWHIVQANPAGRWLCDVVMPGVWAGERLDMLAALADPRGWLSCARSPKRIAAALLGQLRAEQWVRPGLRPRVDALEAVLVARYGCLVPPAQRDAMATSFDVTLDTRLGALSFCAVQTVCGLPHDASGARLRAELWYPTDMRTASLMRQQAERADQTA
ncbi:helix-turn-helix transcriptional regulator [Hydrogenophaga sp.]|uniref:helix-turn-helix transcriptional regulator n=1 Tax=Hydrogenophaga sp. TaxID=1904254 RepID=UPI003D0AD946